MERSATAIRRQTPRGAPALLRALRVAASALALLLAAPVAGAPLPAIPSDRNDAGPDLFDAYNLLAGTAFSGNADLAPHAVDGGTWAGGASSVAIAIGSSAENHNSFGFYDPADPASRTPLLPDRTGFGFLGPVFGAALFSGEGVGFYLETTGKNDDVWHSDASLDSRSGADHMVAFLLPELLQVETDQGPLNLRNGWLLGWEDLRDRRSDGDYDDLLVAIGSATEMLVPEPAAGSLLALGLAALALRRRNGRATRGA